MPLEQEIAQLEHRRLILADPAARPRAEMARYLRSIGMEVLEAASAQETLQLVPTSHPDLVAVDVDLEGDLRALLDQLFELSGSETTKVVLTCRSRTTRGRIAGLIRPTISDVIVLPCRPEMMMERLARVLRGEASAAHRAAAAAAAQNDVTLSSTPPVVVCPTNSSLLQQALLCRFHEKPVASRRFALRLNRVEVEPNFFDVPTYTRAVGNADYVDYHRVCVTVCPKCLFASADPSYFLYPGNPAHLVRQLTPSARYAVMSRAHQRRGVAGDVTEEFFSEFRSGVDAIKSYELALHCSTAMHGAARRPLSDELVRQGNYHLRIAHLQNQLGTAQREQDLHIDSAGRVLKEAFTSLNELAASTHANGSTGDAAAIGGGGALARNTYQCVATSIYQGNDRAAEVYISQLARFRSHVRDPNARTALDRYLGRSAQAFEEREQHRKPTVLPTISFNAPFLLKAA